MENENVWKYQVSLRAGDHMFNYRTDNDDEICRFIGEKFINAEIALESLRKLANKYNKPVEVLIKPTVEEMKVEVNGGCKHVNVKQISGVGQYGPWKGIVCQDCKYSNFEGKSKDGGTYWKGWKAPKPKAEQLPY